MRYDLAAKYDLRAPRYTSYPTAPHFGPAVQASTYRGWLRKLDPAEPVSLYLHVPFCRHLCWFCGCNTAATRLEAPVAAYAARLGEEIDLVTDAVGARLPLRHLHWGGGSPTRMAAADMATLMAQVAKRFAIQDDAEIAIEIDPRTLEPEFAAMLGEAGFNRASIGVQDFDPVVQRAINRVQTVAITAHAIDALHAAGISDFNLDLMYGLPHQTEASVVRTAETAMAFGPSRISLFGYAHVPWMKRHQRLIDESALPGTIDRLRQFDAARRALERGGYVMVGLDHFAHPSDPLVAGPRYRNFQGYTTDGAATLIGVGASAIGSLPQGYVQNASEVPAWRKAIESHQPAIVRGVALSDDDRLRRAVIERLMCDLAVDLDAVARRFFRDPEDLAPSIDALAPLVEDGLVAIDGWRVTVSDDGRTFLRLVCAAFDAYLAGAAQGQGSKAL